MFDEFFALYVVELTHPGYINIYTLHWIFKQVKLFKNTTMSKAAMFNGNFVFATFVANKLGRSPHFCDIAKVHLYYLIWPSFMANFKSLDIYFHIILMLLSAN